MPARAPTAGRDTCGSRDDLLAKLSDVIISEAVAMSGIAGDVDQPRDHLERLAVVTERTGSQPSQGLPAACATPRALSTVPNQGGTARC